MVSIGNVQLENPVILAPMAGVTDLPYRVICEEMGVALTTTEMVSAKAILYKNRNTEELLRTAQDEVVSKKKASPGRSTAVWFGAGYHGGDCGTD